VSVLRYPPVYDLDGYPTGYRVDEETGGLIVPRRRLWQCHDCGKAFVGVPWYFEDAVFCLPCWKATGGPAAKMAVDEAAEEACITYGFGPWSTLPRGRRKESA